MGIPYFGGWGPESGQGLRWEERAPPLRGRNGSPLDASAGASPWSQGIPIWETPGKGVPQFYEEARFNPLEPHGRETHLGLTTI